MKFCIRDDDTCYYTSPDTLENVYGGIWDSIPITVACVPYVSPDSDAAVDATDNEPRDIGENAPLVDLLTEKISSGLVEIALHGYYHDTPNDQPEFVAGKGLDWKVEDGLRRLELAFDTPISSFVPPHVRLSNHGLRAVHKADLNIIRGYGPRPREVQPHPQWVGSYAKLLAFFAKHRKEYRYPHVLDYGTHKEIYSHRLNRRTDIEWCKRAFDYIQRKDGVFCLSVHANALNEVGLRKLHEIVSYAQKPEVEFVTASSIF